MRKIGIFLLVSCLLGGWIHPVQAEVGWDVTASGENPYTMSFTGVGTVTLTSDVDLTYESEITDTIDIEQTPFVTFRATSAPRVVVTEEATGKSVVLVFGANLVVTDEKEATQEPEVEQTGETPGVQEEKKPRIQEKKASSNQTKATVSEEKVTVEPTGYVEGTVWYDQNEDGVRQKTEPLLDDVNVFLMNQNHDVLQAVITSGGHYTFKPAVPGRYLVKVDGYEIGLYTFSKRNQGNDRLMDSDVNQYGGDAVTIGDDGIVIDAGMTEGNEDIAESHFLTVANFVDMDHNQRPGMKEKSVRATYTLLDTVTGEAFPTETVEEEDALALEVPLGTYILKVELPVGYSVQAIHEANYEIQESEDGSVTEKYERFTKGLKRTKADAIIDLTKNRQGTVVVVEVTKTEPVVKPKPNENPEQNKNPKQNENSESKPSVPTKKSVEVAVTKTVAKETADQAVERLPQAGEEVPFPYAVAGMGLVVAGLWLLIRRSA